MYFMTNPGLDQTIFAPIKANKPLAWRVDRAYKNITRVKMAVAQGIRFADNAAKSTA
jgi:hypothetical protein